MSFQPIHTPKGTRDLFSQDVELFQKLEETARFIFRLYEFREVRTPLFEAVELFSRSLGDSSDVVQKEMFVFTDRGERTFALRPEGTAGIVRHFIEHNLAVQGGEHRLFYVGPMFRAERPQAGRFRQFWQIGSEHFGSESATTDAETVVMIFQILTQFGLKNFSIQVNSLGCKTCRPQYREALLNYLNSKESILSEESKKRKELNPLRVLDSKEDGPKLTDAPTMKSYLCAECKDHYALFLSLVTKAGLPIEENLRLVRGLDYYTRTVFEFVSTDLGAQSALAAGGRYDDLVHMLGGAQVPGIGFALGMDRLVMALQKNLAQKTEIVFSPRKIVIIPMCAEAIEVSFLLAHQLRIKGYAVPPLNPKKKLKNQLSLAVDVGAKWAILIGEDELKDRHVTIKNLETREQSKVALDKVGDHLGVF